MADNRGLFPGWLPHLGDELSTPGLSGPQGGLPGWMHKTGSIGSAPSNPLITTTTDPFNYESVVSIQGSNFGGTEGSIFIGSVQQTVTSWSDTIVYIEVDRGTLRYGTYLLYLYTSTGELSTIYVNLEDGVGDRWVTLVDPLAPYDQRITAIPDLEAGDQLAWGGIVGTGSVTIRSDGTFVADDTVTSFWVEVNDGTGWSSRSTQTLDPTPVTSTLNFKKSGSWVGLDQPWVRQNNYWKPVYSGYMKWNGTWRKFFPEGDAVPIGEIIVPGDGDYVNGVTVFYTSALDDVAVDNVKLYTLVGGAPQLVTTKFSAPWNLTVDFTGWTNAAYEFYIVVADTNGSTWESTHIQVTVDNNLPPVVQIVSPQDGTALVNDYTIVASASDPNPTGSIANVKFYEDGSLLSTDTTSPYSHSVDVSAKNNGTYTYTAVATDNLGAQTTSQPVNIILQKPAAPVLSSAQVLGTGYDSSGAYISSRVFNNSPGGYVYYVLSTNSTTPSAAQVISGVDGAGYPAIDHSFRDAYRIGFNYFTSYGLTTSRTYYLWYVQEDHYGQTSTVVGTSTYVAPQLSATLDRTSVTGNGSSVGTSSGDWVIATTSPPVVVTVSGATGSYTIQWQKVSGDDAGVNTVSSNSFTFVRNVFVTADATGVGFVTKVGVFRAIVTDSVNNVAYSPNITVTTNHSYSEIN